MKQRATIIDGKRVFKLSDRHPPSAPYIAADGGRHSAIVINKIPSSDVVQFIPMDSVGLVVQTMDRKQFESAFRLVENYALDRALEIYERAATDFGATEAACLALAQLRENGTINPAMLTAKENDMATKKPAAKAAKPTKDSKPKAAKATKEAGEKKPSAAMRFKELIRERKQTDDQIFATVQKEFGLDDDKRSYVAWYRNHIKKTEGKEFAAVEPKK